MHWYIFNDQSKGLCRFRNKEYSISMIFVFLFVQKSFLFCRYLQHFFIVDFTGIWRYCVEMDKVDQWWRKVGTYCKMWNPLLNTDAVAVIICFTIINRLLFSFCLFVFPFFLSVILFNSCSIFFFLSLSIFFFFSFLLCFFFLIIDFFFFFLAFLFFPFLI